MKTRTPIVMLMFTTLFGASLTSACGAKVEPDAVTETGNPSLIDKTRITATPLDGAIDIRGEKDAVPANAIVTATNRRTDETQTTTAKDDGSFSLQIEGQEGDRIVLDVESDGKSDELKLTVEDATPAAPPTGDTTTAVQTVIVAPTSDTAPVVTAPNDTTDFINTDDETAIDTTDVIITVPEDDETTDAPRPIASTPVKHRTEGSQCDSERAAGDVESADYPIDGECTSDAECQDGNLGRCENNRDYGYCTYDECTADSACTEGPCECGVGPRAANTCMQGNCHLDTDCGDDGYCSPSLSGCGNYSGVVGYWCHTPEDECMNDDECASETQGKGYCMYSSEVAHWLCAYTHCVG